jgi:hypothetical protein
MYLLDKREEFDREQVELGRLYRQLEAWREAYRDMRCRHGLTVTRKFMLECERLAKKCAEVLE